MSLGELLQERAKHRELGSEGRGVRAAKIVSVRGILSGCYSRAVEGRKTYSLARHCMCRYVSR
jgi:hypothetical protein